MWNSSINFRTSAFHFTICKRARARAFDAIVRSPCIRFVRRAAICCSKCNCCGDCALVERDRNLQMDNLVINKIDNKQQTPQQLYVSQIFNSSHTTSFALHYLFPCYSVSCTLTHCIALHTHSVSLLFRFRVVIFLFLCVLFYILHFFFFNFSVVVVLFLV